MPSRFKREMKEAQIILLRVQWTEYSKLSGERRREAGWGVREVWKREQKRCTLKIDQDRGKVISGKRINMSKGREAESK